MATFSVVASKHATLSDPGDIVRLTSTWPSVQIINRSDDTDDYLYAKVSQANLSDPIAVAADDTLVIPAGKVLTLSTSNTGNVWIALAGPGIPYSVQGVRG